MKCACIRAIRFYQKNLSPLKPGCWFSTDRGRYWTPDELMTMYLHSVGRNCNLLLNCAPMPDGQEGMKD